MYPYIIDFDVKKNSKPGELVCLEYDTVGIDIKRVFYIYGFSPVTNGVRGQHGHTNSNQLLVCVSGSVDIETRHIDGTQKSFKLDSPKSGLMLLLNNVVTMKNFSENAILLVACDTEFKDEITFNGV